LLKRGRATKEKGKGKVEARKHRDGISSERSQTCLSAGAGGFGQQGVKKKGGLAKKTKSGAGASSQGNTHIDGWVLGPKKVPESPQNAAGS